MAAVSNGGYAMAIFELLLLILVGLNVATMFSGFMLARRMGYHLMPQVMMLMFGMFVSFGILAVNLILPDFTIWLVLANFVFILIALLLEFATTLPILMKTMQGAPIHSSHITNLLISFFFLLGLVLYYTDLSQL